jgi:histone H3/H4
MARTKQTTKPSSRKTEGKEGLKSGIAKKRVKNTPMIAAAEKEVTKALKRREVSHSVERMCQRPILLSISPMSKMFKSIARAYCGSSVNMGKPATLCLMNAVERTVHDIINDAKGYMPTSGANKRITLSNKDIQKAIASGKFDEVLRPVDARMKLIRRKSK